MPKGCSWEGKFLSGGDDWLPEQMRGMAVPKYTKPFFNYAFEMQEYTLELRS